MSGLSSRTGLCLYEDIFLTASGRLVRKQRNCIVFTLVLRGTPPCLFIQYGPRACFTSSVTTELLPEWLPVVPRLDLEGSDLDQLIQAERGKLSSLGLLAAISPLKHVNLTHS